MKKLLFLTVLVAVSHLTALAEEMITVEDLAVPQGRQAELVVSFSFNEAHEYVSYQFTVELPEGVTLVSDAYGKAAITLADNQPQAVYNVDFLASNGIVKVYSSPSTPIAGSNGVLARIPVEASADLAVGTTLSGRMKDVEFTWNTGAVRTVFADAPFTITVAEPRLLFDENATALPPFQDGEKADVRMTRTIKGGRWNTIVLPFTLTKAKAEVAFGSDVQLAEFAGFETTYTDDEDVTPDAIQVNLAAYTMTARKGMTGGKPYFIKTSHDVEGFTADDVTLAAAVTDDSKSDEWDTPGRLTGTLVKTTIPADGLFLNGGNFWYSTGQSVVRAFRCWLELGAVLDKETDFGARITLHFLDSEATGVSEAAAGREATDGTVYNLSGQRVATAGKGVYIVNGKKVVKR